MLATLANASVLMLFLFCMWRLFASGGFGYYLLCPGEIMQYFSPQETIEPSRMAESTLFGAYRIVPLDPNSLDRGVGVFSRLASLSCLKFLFH